MTVNAEREAGMGKHGDRAGVVIELPEVTAPRPIKPEAAVDE